MTRWLSRLLGRSADRVSSTWLRQQHQSDWTRGIDGPCWAWPIEKAKTENGRLNAWLARRERRRAA